MSELAEAILDAKYADLIGIGAFLIVDLGVDVAWGDEDNRINQEELAASIHRWAASQIRDED